MSRNVFDLKILDLRACKHERESVAMRNLSGVRREKICRDSIMSKHSAVTMRNYMSYSLQFKNVKWRKLVRKMFLY